MDDVIQERTYIVREGDKVLAEDFICSEDIGADSLLFRLSELNIFNGEPLHKVKIHKHHGFELQVNDHRFKFTDVRHDSEEF